MMCLVMNFTCGYWKRKGCDRLGLHVPLALDRHTDIATNDSTATRHHLILTPVYEQLIGQQPDFTQTM